MLRRVRGKGTFINETAKQRRGTQGAARQVRTDSLFGLVLPELMHGFYPVLQKSFSDAAAAGHGQVLVCNTDQDARRQADILLQLADQKVSGIAIVPTSAENQSTPAHQIRPIQAMGIPVVLCHRVIEGVSAPLVSYSGVEVGRRAAQAMLAKGHRRIAYFATHCSSMAEFYLQGLREVLGQAGLSLPESRIFVGRRFGHAIPAEHRQRMDEAIGRMFGEPDPPTVIFSSFDPDAELIFLLLSERGWRVPHDVSLLGVGGSPRLGAFTQQLTSIVVDENELGRKAMELLRQMGRGKRPLTDAEVFTVSLSLSDGATLGKPASYKDI